MKGSEPSFFNHTYIVDFEGNYISESTFNDVIKILSNRNNCMTSSDFIKMPRALVEGTYIEKLMEWDYIDFNIEYEDGLTYTQQERAGDNKGYWQYVNDKLGNKIGLNDFHLGILMLNNGRIFLNNLCSHWEEKCSNSKSGRLNHI